MISQRHLQRPRQPHNSKTNTPKTFSLLSLGLSTKPGQSNKLRFYENETTNQIKRQKEFAKHTQDDNRRAQVKDNPNNSFNIAVDSHGSFGQSGQCSSWLQVEKGGRKVLDEDIVYTNHKFSFQSLTNRMMDESHEMAQGCQKENCNILNQNLEEIEEPRDKGEKLLVNLKKKIKKLDKNSKVASRPFHFDKPTQHLRPIDAQLNDSREMLASAHSHYLNNPLSDYEVYPDSFIYRSQLIPQRIDNDVDSDDEQIEKGVQRFHRFLAEAVHLNTQPLAAHLNSQPAAHSLR